MTWWQALILGIIEGLTEFLPVSSTGHLLLAQRMLGIDQNAAADAYVVVIQIGAILAVTGLYWKRIREMLLGLAGKSAAGLRMAVNIAVAFMPAAIVGLLFNKQIEANLFGLWPITTAWIVGGLAILGTVKFRKQRPEDEHNPGLSLEDMTWKLALIIGLAQCLAMWPGTSRSLVTIVAGVLVGLRLKGAVEFSFLLGVVTLSAASFYKMVDGGAAMADQYDLTSVLLGIIAAGVSAAIAVKWMVAYLSKHSLAIFGYYRIALGATVAILILTQLLVG